MKRFIIGFLALISTSMALGQHILTYQSYAKGVEGGDTTFVMVNENAGFLKISNMGVEVKSPIPGYVESKTYVDYRQDSVFTLLEYPEARCQL